MRIIHLVAVLALLSLVLAGCVSETGTGGTGSDVAGNGAGAGTSGTGTSGTGTDGAGTSGTGNASANGSGTGQLWGEECRKDIHCGHDTVCVYGSCVTPECEWLSDCPEGTDLCFDNACVSMDELYAQYGVCQNRIRCEQTCGNCMEGTYDCTHGMVSSGNTTTTYDICVECTEDEDCKGNYRCAHYKCVPGPE